MLEFGDIPPELAESPVVLEAFLPVGSQIQQLLVSVLQDVASFFDNRRFYWLVAGAIGTIRRLELLSLVDCVTNALSDDVNVRLEEGMLLQEVFHIHQVGSMLLREKSGL